MKPNKLSTAAFFTNSDINKRYCLKVMDEYGKTHFFTGTFFYVRGAVLDNDQILEYMEF